MPQQLAGAEDLVPVITPVIVPIFGPLGLLRSQWLYDTTNPYQWLYKWLPVQVATVSIFTYLQGSPPMDYEYVIRELLSSEVPQIYTTIKTEQQSKENMMGVIRARTRKATVLPREFGPVNWYNALVDPNGQPFRFLLWSTDTSRKIINASLRTSPNARSDYSLHLSRSPIDIGRSSRARVPGSSIATSGHCTCPPMD